MYVVHRPSGGIEIFTDNGTGVLMRVYMGPNIDSVSEGWTSFFSLFVRYGRGKSYE